MKRLSLFVMLGLAVLSLAGCQDRHQWNQKLTVTVQTSSGDVSGASVVEVVALFGQIPGSASEVNYTVRGEATAVEVAPGKYLFALLEGSEERFYSAARSRIETQKRGEWLKLIPDMKGAVELSHSTYPLLVTFDDIADPKTIKRVDPADLAATFGPGYALTSITLEITDETVIEGKVQNVLGWLGDGKTLKSIWGKLSPEQHDLLSSANWKTRN